MRPAIFSPMRAMAGRKSVSQMLSMVPFSPNASTKSLMRTAGKAPLGMRGSLSFAGWQEGKMRGSGWSNPCCAYVFTTWLTE